MYVRNATALLAAALVVWSAEPIAPATAQDLQQIRLFEEIGRLREDIGDLQRQIYQRGSQPGAGAVLGADAAERAARTEVRLGQVEDEMRALTGSVENVAHDVQQLISRTDRLVVDMDARLKTLERSQAVAAAMAPAPTAAAPSPAAAAEVFTPVATAPPAPAAVAPVATAAVPVATAAVPVEAEDGPFGGSESLSSLLFPQPAVEAEPPVPVALAPAAPEAAPAPQVAALPPGDPEQQYDFAFDLLRKRDWLGAEGALRAFIDIHPDSELTGNAYYWLAETFYVRSNLEQAAVYFARGYQDFPDSLKAPANLLKLGMSLARLGRTNDACLTFQELSERFPNASPLDRQRAESESRRAGCG